MRKILLNVSHRVARGIPYTVASCLLAVPGFRFPSSISVFLVSALARIFLRSLYDGTGDAKTIRGQAGTHRSSRARRDRGQRGQDTEGRKDVRTMIKYDGNDYQLT